MREPLPADVREAIRARRIQIGYSQPQAAKAAGVSITTWNGAEKGRSNPQPLQRAAMCRLLGWTVDSIDLLEAGAKPIPEGTPRPRPGEQPDTGPDDVAEREALEARVRRLEAVVHHLAGEQAVREWGNGKPAGGH